MPPLESDADLQRKALVQVQQSSDRRSRESLPRFREKVILS